MKKLMLIISLLGVFIIANAQVDKNEILERLKLELLPQTKDYNPYQYARERYIIDNLDVWMRHEKGNCERGKELIEMFYNNNDTTEFYRDKVDYIIDIALFKCQQAYDFLEDQIKNNPSEKIRCKAIEYLAWSLNSNYVPCIMEYAKRDSLSVQEKSAIAKAFTTFGIYASHSDLKEEAIKILDETCYDFSSDDIQQGCALTYYKLGGEAAINYHTLLLEQREGFRRAAIAGIIAELGDYETTFPMFVEAIERGTTNDILIAIDGLKVIGTEEALRLIEEQTQNKNEKIAKKAQEVLGELDKKRREE